MDMKDNFNVYESKSKSNMKTICLNMIVKNEGHIIEKTLEMLTQQIHFSYWVISDTGSTDNTKELIVNFFLNKQIPGELVEHEWRDFGTNRTFALESAYNKSDYILIFDADDFIHGKCLLPELNDDMYHFKFGKDFVYKRPLLMNNRIKWKYCGVLHEYIICIDNCKTQSVIRGDYYVESGKSGSRSHDPDKYKKDAMILENAFHSELDNGLKDRYAFYCAQSYMDANNIHQSIKWYKLVVDELTNWNQEKYYSCLMIAKLSRFLNNDMDIISYLSKAGKYDNERYEHIKRLMEYFYDKGLHLLVNSLYIQNKDYKNKGFTRLDEKLFVSLDDYDYHIEYYNSISAYYTGNFESGYECCKKIILSDTSDMDKTRLFTVVSNLYFYKDFLLNSPSNKVFIQEQREIFNRLNKYLPKLSDKNNNHNINIDKIFNLWNTLYDNLVFEFAKCSDYNNISLKISDPICDKKQNKQYSVFLSMTSCKRYDLFEKTMNSILNQWKDKDLIDHWFCVDDNSNLEDREKMKKKYPFFDYYFKIENEKGHRNSMNIIWNKLNELKPTYWIHMEDDFVFYEELNYIEKGIQGLEMMRDKNVGQILFNRCYSETIEDYRLKGFTFHESDLLKEYCIHDYNSNCDNSYMNCQYWPHYSFRPSIIDTNIILKLGNFDSPNHFFEMDYAYKWTHRGYKSAFFNKITNRHIGRLTKERDNKSILNAYELNNENQFTEKNEDNDNTFPKIKIINLNRRNDRRENIDNLFKLHDISYNLSEYEFINAVDGKELSNNYKQLHLFKGNDFGNRRGFIGCALSHYNLWLNLIQDKTCDYYLIMEDDFNIRNNFKECIRHLHKEMKRREIIFLGYHMFSKDRENVKDMYDVNVNIEELYNLNIRKLNKDLFIGGTHCYSINKQGAIQLINYINEHGIKHGIDYVMGKLNSDICYEIQPHICFADWNENGKQIDTDIQSNYDSVEILDYKNENEIESIVSEFIFIKGKDQFNYDMFYKKDSLLENMKTALSSDNCIGFNTLGFFKHTLNELTPSQYFTDTDGIYIKKIHYLHNLNNINNDNKISLLNENETYNKRDFHNKIRVKLLCNWCSSEELCKEWSIMNNNEYIYSNIEITYEDENIDYYVIINKPFTIFDKYIQSKTIVLQMEPYVNDKNKPWGVKTWGDWSHPDETKFLYVGTHKKYLNTVQWQIKIPDANMISSLNKSHKRQDRIISILSRKDWDTGHQLRINFIKYIENINKHKIDVFGEKNFHNIKNYKGQLKDNKKENHLIDYNYCVSVENNSELNYATEKIWEPILCECLCFYWGCPNLEDYIDSRAFVRLDLNNFKESLDIINQAIEEDWWSQRIEYIKQEKERIINELGFFPFMNKFINNYQIQSSK